MNVVLQCPPGLCLVAAILSAAGYPAMVRAQGASAPAVQAGAAAPEASAAPVARGGRAGRGGGRGNAAETEVWTPVPPKVAPARMVPSEPPSDAIVLFDGRNTDEWVATNGKGPVAWTVTDGVLTVNKAVRSNIETKRTFLDYQLHLEWRIPTNISGSGQNRGNSGLFMASTGGGDAGYELQILDSHENATYANGMAGSIYKQFIPLANPSRPAGEWNSYDVAWTAPRFEEDGRLKSPARITVFFNGVLVHNNVELRGQTVFIGQPAYTAHGPTPIKLQTHGDPSEPISFRNIWIRETGK